MCVYACERSGAFLVAFELFMENHQISKGTKMGNFKMSLGSTCHISEHSHFDLNYFLENTS